MAIRFDEIGYWSEVKLDIVRKYASAYSRIMANQQGIRGHFYIDAFAGAGVHVSKRTSELVPGSPLNALSVEPPFSGYHFIDLKHEKVELLKELATGRKDVTIHEGNCNKVLPEKVFPCIRYEAYQRALCLLDPYGLDLDWEVVYTAGQSRAIEIFLNFPVMDMNRNVFWSCPEKVGPAQVGRMNAFWGDDSWLKAGYREAETLFGPIKERTSNEIVAQAYRERLKGVAGFRYVPQPIPMRNSKGATVYYLFFATPNRTADKIVRDIFRKYENRGLE